MLVASLRSAKSRDLKVRKKWVEVIKEELFEEGNA
jgi:hypothetical protein